MAILVTRIMRRVVVNGGVFKAGYSPEGGAKVPAQGEKAQLWSKAGEVAVVAKEIVNKEGSDPDALTLAMSGADLLSLPYVIGDVVITPETAAEKRGRKGADPALAGNGSK